MDKPDGEKTKEERLAEALRANLRRRKQQSRGRVADGGVPAPPNKPENPPS